MGNPIGEMLDLPGKINVYFWLAFHPSAFISKFSEKAFLQTSIIAPLPPPSQKFLATALYLTTIWEKTKYAPSLD